jgi:hypothetical protein
MFLRQSTSASVVLGPFTGSSGVGLTGLTITQSEVMISKNGGAFAAKNETTAASHRTLGYYSVELDNTDTNAAGRLLAVSSAAAALPVWHSFAVLPTSVYDYMFSTGIQKVDAAAVGGNVTAATNLAAWQAQAVQGAVADPAPTLLAFMTNLPNPNNNFYADRLVLFTAGSAEGQLLPVYSYIAASKQVVFDESLALAPASGDTFMLLADHQHPVTQPAQYTVLTSASFAVSAVNRLANLLAVDMSSISAPIAARSPINALRALRNRVTTSGTICTVFGEDDSTAVYTATLTTNASADPIVEINPS